MFDAIEIVYVPNERWSWKRKFIVVRGIVKKFNYYRFHQLRSISSIKGSELTHTTDRSCCKLIRYSRIEIQVFIRLHSDFFVTHSCEIERQCRAGKQHQIRNRERAMQVCIRPGDAAEPLVRWWSSDCTRRPTWWRPANGSRSRMTVRLSSRATNWNWYVTQLWGKNCVRSAPVHSYDQMLAAAWFKRKFMTSPSFIYLTSIVDVDIE